MTLLRTGRVPCFVIVFKSKWLPVCINDKQIQSNYDIHNKCTGWHCEVALKCRRVRAKMAPKLGRDDTQKLFQNDVETGQ